MSDNERRRAGRHFLQIPGPSPVPERVLRAIDMPMIDHRGPEFEALGQRVLAGIKGVFKTDSRVFIYPTSGTGAWEAALTNTAFLGRLRSHVSRQDISRRSGRTWRKHLRAAAGIHRLRLARRRRCRAHREPAARGYRPFDQGGLRRAQRDFDRGDLPYRRSPQGDRRGGAIPLCCWSTPFPGSPAPTIATTNGASTSASPARRRG